MIVSCITYEIEVYICITQRSPNDLFWFFNCFDRGRFLRTIFVMTQIQSEFSDIWISFDEFDFHCIIVQWKKVLKEVRARIQVTEKDVTHPVLAPVGKCGALWPKCAFLIFSQLSTISALINGKIEEIGANNILQAIIVCLFYLLR